MPIRAHIAKGFVLRLAAVAVVSTGFALWALYDGSVGYPQQRERALKYQELAGEDELMDEREQMHWDMVASDHGWPLEDPGPPKTKYDIAMQYIMVASIAPVGLLFLYFLVRNWGRWVEADESGLNTSWDQALYYDQIVSLDKKQWKDKGIARVHYDQDGRKARLVLDDFKYDFKPIKEILLAVEAHLEADQILNGPPESREPEPELHPQLDPQKETDHAPTNAASSDDAA